MNASTGNLILGWDVGGAHLKRAVLAPDGILLSVEMAACPLWQGLDRLDTAIAALSPAAGRSVVTMTGELTDLWPDRAAGVAGLSRALAERLGADTLIYAGRAGFVPAADAPDHPADVASANWHATAAALARMCGDGVLVDVGSTTTDIIKFAGTQVNFAGYSDAGRLETGELVYSGAARTPVMALAATLPFRGRQVPLMAEHFATTADIHRLTGDLPEGADLYPAADGGEKTREASARRLLRMVGRDLGPCAMAEAEALAAFASEVQLHRLHGALAQVLSTGGVAAEAPLVGAGVGRFLAARLAARAGRPYRDAGEVLSGAPALAAAASDCAPAVAVARLAID
ncbi:S-layer protein [Xanthobacter autotrophicus]|uniref:hydantoinase/oxoprolinase family protein n=1 Tax=Xanthobacter TaxID=279 RepID=UPI0024AA3A1A|nr:hydantoinase/oxoprolinase family protein [Xanthobacter autotrophicus]MDI4665704.1 S-layer protein [Xanthobacter autotrophicus]